MTVSLFIKNYEKKRKINAKKRWKRKRNIDERNGNNTETNAREMINRHFERNDK
jgi:hypothetical protein